MADRELIARWEFARLIATQAGQSTLAWFDQPDVNVELKSDRSPVTAADRAAEMMLRERIGERFPQDGILGEEFGSQDGSNEFRWILDPIDGTRSFVRGVPLFGTMVAVERAGDPQIGVLYFPALDESVAAARGLGAWHQRRGEAEQRAQVSPRRKLADAVLVSSDTATFATRGLSGAWQRLQRACSFTRTWGDAYGYLLVATGRVEAMLDPVLNIWDAAAVMPIIQEAGGRFTDWHGAPKIDSGDACGSNGWVHDDVLAALQIP